MLSRVYRTPKNLVGKVERERLLEMLVQTNKEIRKGACRVALEDAHSQVRSDTNTDERRKMGREKCRHSEGRYRIFSSNEELLTGAAQENAKI